LFQGLLDVVKGSLVSHDDPLEQRGQERGGVEMSESTRTRHQVTKLVDVVQVRPDDGRIQLPPTRHSTATASPDDLGAAIAATCSVSSATERRARRPDSDCARTSTSAPRGSHSASRVNSSASGLEASIHRSSDGDIAASDPCQSSHCVAERSSNRTVVSMDGRQLRDASAAAESAPAVSTRKPSIAERTASGSDSCGK